MARPRKLVAAFQYSYAEQLALWQEGLAKLSTAQEVEIMGKRITRADLDQVRGTIDWLERKVAAEQAGDGGYGPRLYEGRVV
jgi:hypothetical protein